ncbi:hypothetical protein P43SY_003088 [Pythium insidiosum]|uniref:Saposin B-type domain-containing protein n=1 Tax=Pythium insidiosum TaxID=114742 RepID=A0AAD5LSU0_PYTIN|nr:hypothetical protein P43SY_003088 [Pythium insidiosum]KAJ0411690.1 hypothetical protein ATCC90586_002074 [Pythium insidiosum]
MKGAGLLLCAAALGWSPATAWTSRWDHSKRFQAAGHAERDLQCDGKTEQASCCICRSIVHEIETQLNNTQDDHDIDVVFRISEEKKTIKFSRSEVRILEVLDDVCERLPLQLPDATPRKRKALSAACTSFVGEFEDELINVFFNNFEPAKHRMCSATLDVCPKAEAPSVEKDDL